MNSPRPRRGESTRQFLRRINQYPPWLNRFTATAACGAFAAVAGWVALQDWQFVLGCGGAGACLLWWYHLKTRRLLYLAVALSTAGCVKQSAPVQSQVESDVELDRIGRYQLVDRKDGPILLDSATGKMWIFRPSAEDVRGGFWIVMPDVVASARARSTNTAPLAAR
jgi:hypothetical protein